MRVTVKSELPQPPKKVWDLLQKPETLFRISKPIVEFHGRNVPKVWAEGEPVKFRVTYQGKLQPGEHTVTFKKIDEETLEMETSESSPEIKRWVHKITLKPLENGNTLYKDSISFSAGMKTPLYWLVNRALYRHRHEQMRKLL